MLVRSYGLYYRVAKMSLPYFSAFVSSSFSLSFLLFWNTRYNRPVRTHHSFPGWNDFCCQGNGEVGYKDSVVDWRGDHIEVSHANELLAVLYIHLNASVYKQWWNLGCFFIMLSSAAPCSISSRAFSLHLDQSLGQDTSAARCRKLPLWSPRPLPFLGFLWLVIVFSLILSPPIQFLRFLLNSPLEIKPGGEGVFFGTKTFLEL